MAYPTTIDSFSTKVDAVDYPQASHVNALQVAVSALETKVGVDSSAVATSIDYIIKNNIWPIGSIYINAGVATNPATLLGFGTWTAFGAGKMIIGIDSGDADFDSLADTGGAKTSTALIAHTHIGPSHTHTGTTGTVSVDHSHTYSGTSSGESGHVHGPESGVTHFGMYDASNTNEDRGTLGTGDRGRYSATTGASTGHTHTYSGTTSGISANHTHAFTSDAAGTGATGSAGSGSSFSILNPYICAYMWRRTA